MKKRIQVYSMLALCCFLGLAGCKKKTDSTDISSLHTTAATTAAPKETLAQESATTAEETKKGESNADDTSSSKGSHVTSKLETYSSGNRSVQYPQLQGLENETTAQKVNQLLKDNATAILSAWELGENDEVSVKCKIISLNRNQVTAVYTGTSKTSEGAYPVNVFYTNTVDIEKSSDIGFDRYADSKSMAAYVLSPDCELVGVSGDLKTSVREYLNGQDASYYETLFLNADFPLRAKSEDGTTQFPESFSYADQDAIYFSVPLPHALGDYVLVAFKPETK